MRRHPFALALIAIGVLLRLLTLSHHSLWLDEAFSVAAASTHSAAAIWSPGVDPIHPPLYYLVLHACLSIFGVSEIAARLPSAFASIVNIALIWWLGQRLFPGRRVGMTAALLLALSPLDFWYAQEARMYEMVATAGLVLSLGFVVEAWWSAVLIVLGLAGGLYLDHTMWPVAMLVVGLGLTRWLNESRSQPQLLRAIVGIGIGLALCKPVWAQALVAYGELDGVSLFKVIRQTLRVRTMTAISLPFVMIGCTAFAFGLVRSAAVLLQRHGWRAWVPRIIVVGFTLATAIVAVPRAYSLKQVLVCVWPLAVLFASWAIAAGERERRTAVVGAASLCALAMTFMTPRADWRGVAAFLSGSELARATVILDPPYNAQPYAFYRPVPTARQGPLESRDALSGSDVVCIIAERFGTRPPTSKTEAWMEANLTLVAAMPFSRLELRCYRP